MKLSNVLLKPLSIKSSYFGRALAGAVLLSVSASGWAGENSRAGEGHKDRHRNHEQRHGDHRRDNHNEHRRDSERHHARHRDGHRQSQHQKRHHARHHYVAPKHHSNHHAKHRHSYHHSNRHSSHEAAFLLGGVILGAVLSDVSRVGEDYYYDGRATRSYRNLRTETCYRSYYENGRRVLVETSSDYCRAY